jgi:hypothetical protein
VEAASSPTPPKADTKVTATADADAPVASASAAASALAAPELDESVLTGARSRVAAGEALHVGAQADRTRRIPERTVAFAAGLLALLALALATVLNVMLVPGLNAGSARTLTVNEKYEPAIHLKKPALAMLPEDVLAYETIARQTVPGKEQTAAESIYNTLNMNLEVQVPINSYARVDAYAAEADADQALTALMARFPKKRSTLKLMDGTQAVTGYSPDDGSWTVAWTRGQYVTWVKTTFTRHIPYEKRKFLENTGMPVIQAVDKFQVTGKQGLRRN